MTDKLLPEALYDLGYTELVSVIPPNSQLTPSSKISTSGLGKVPGRRLPNGLWCGYDWRKYEASAEDARQWALDGANLGLRAGKFPGLDIDCTDASLVEIIETAAKAQLGWAPKRTGRAPKSLLMYRADDPFSRMRLFIERGEHKHLVEFLGHGQQYLIAGTHPVTLLPYSWDTDLTSMPVLALTLVTREKVEAFFAHLKELLDMIGAGRVVSEGDGRKLARNVATKQDALRAPSIDDLRSVVELIPNDDDLFPSRDDYVKMGAAIRAAAGEENEPDGFNIFAEWAGRHEADGRVSGNPETWLSDWRRLRGPFAVGWSWLAELARPFGYNDAGTEFEASDAPAPVEKDERAPLYSDQWLAEHVVSKRNSELRYAPEQDRWYVWEGGVWQPDAVLRAENVVKTELRKVGNRVAVMGSTAREMKEYESLARTICSSGKASAVRQLMQSDPRIAVSASALDYDSWKLNTKNGIINLRDGTLLQPDPDQLCTRSTPVPVDFNGACPEWHRFLNEATGGDDELKAYVQRLAGYCLTGSTREQHLSFIWGRGGNGKGVLLNTLLGILGTYAGTATMDTFTASANERHTTDLAMMQGLRLVTASETQAGKRWDEARVKSMTGGDPITARFMRQDNFTFLPQFKLVFIGNHKPEIRNLDDAMQRRIHLVPFDVTPKVRDNELPEKLKAEWPAILAWMVEGCLAWQQEGLNPPSAVKATTREYFADEDTIGRWIEECCDTSDPEAAAESTTLFSSWREWANANGIRIGDVRQLVTALNARKFWRWKHPQTRRAGFKGIQLKTEFATL